MSEEPPSLNNKVPNNPYYKPELNYADFTKTLSLKNLFIDAGIVTHLGAYVLSFVALVISFVALTLVISFALVTGLISGWNDKETGEFTFFGIIFIIMIIITILYPLYGISSQYLFYSKPNIPKGERIFLAIVMIPVVYSTISIIAGISIGITAVVPFFALVLFPLLTAFFTGPLHLFFYLKLNKKKYRTMMQTPIVRYSETPSADINPEILTIQQEVENLRNEIANQQPVENLVNQEIKKMEEEIASLKAQIISNSLENSLKEPHLQKNIWTPEQIIPEHGRFEGTYLKGGPYIIAFVLASLILTATMGGIIYGVFSIYDKSDDGSSITKKYADEILDCNRTLVICQ
jgi:hypothetical protein